MTENITQKPRSNNLRAVIQTIQAQSTDAAEGTNTSNKAADTDRISNVFNVLIKARTAEPDNLTKLIIQEKQALEDQKKQNVFNTEAKETEQEILGGKAAPLAKKGKPMNKSISNLFKALKKSSAETVPANEGDKEKTKEVKPFNMEKLMACVKAAKAYKDPALDAAKENVVDAAKNQAKEGVGAVLGFEKPKLTETMTKSLLKKTESIRIRLKK
jgi:hypothetical protein